MTRETEEANELFTKALHNAVAWQNRCVDLWEIIEMFCLDAEAEKQEPVAIGEEWKPCVKLPIIVHVREQREGESHVSTREGITPVRTDDLIMRGVAGEEYPIGRELFNRTYTFDTTPPSVEAAIEATLEKAAKIADEVLGENNVSAAIRSMK